MMEGQVPLFGGQNTSRTAPGCLPDSGIEVSQAPMRVRATLAVVGAAAGDAAALLTGASTREAIA